MKYSATIYQNPNDVFTCDCDPEDQYVTVFDLSEDDAATLERICQAHGLGIVAGPDSET